MNMAAAVIDPEKDATNRCFVRPATSTAAGTISTMSGGRDLESNEAKRRAWGSVQAVEPELASFLKEAAEAFGPPSGVRIEVEGEVLFDNLPPMPPRRYPPARPKRFKRNKW